MTVVALAEAVALVTLGLGFLRALAWQQRAHSRREDLLVNQLLHAAGKSWQPAPADTKAEAAEPAPAAWTATPEQRPVD